MLNGRFLCSIMSKFRNNFVIRARKLISFTTMLLSTTIILASCNTTSQTSAISAISEVNRRPLVYANYPQSGYTYLSFSKAHGYQVNYIGSSGKAWLWYPGNSRIVPELWKRDIERNAVCWAHPSNTYNPVTKTKGHSFMCENHTQAAKAVVSQISGDIFNLSAGKIPYRLEKCKAPVQFKFDRAKYKC